jgi:branched-chain amino acid aminotransferase
MAENIGSLFVHNGLLRDSADFDDGFLAYPSYIYEVFRVIDGIPLFLEDHCDRLAQTAALTGFELPFSCYDIDKQVHELIRANVLGIGNLKIVYLPDDFNSISEKNDGISDILPHPGRGAFMIYIIEHQYPSVAQFRDGVQVVLFRGIRENPNAKVMDVALRRQTNEVKARDEAYETLLVDAQDCITEGSRSNVFFVIGDNVITPPLADVLPGITRKHIIACCRDKQIPFAEEKMPIERLKDIDAAFLSGTSRKVLPIHHIDQRPLDPANEVIRNIQHAFNNRVTVYLLRTSLEAES